MFLKQEANLNGCPPEDQFVPSKDGLTFSLECSYCHEWGNIANNFPQISSYCVRGGGGGHGGGARTGGRSGTLLLLISVGFSQNTN